MGIKGNIPMYDHVLKKNEQIKTPVKKEPASPDREKYIYIKQKLSMAAK